MPEPKLKVFLCHSSDDKPTVRELYRRLSAEGWIDVWLDEEKLFPGQDWNLEIEKAVEASDAILVCLSNKSITKEGYVQRELRAVLDFADYKPEGTLYLIPIRLEGCEPPRRLRSWQYADYFPEKDRARAYQRLLVSLRMRASSLGISTAGQIGNLPHEDGQAMLKNAEASPHAREATLQGLRSFLPKLKISALVLFVAFLGYLLWQGAISLKPITPISNPTETRLAQATIPAASPFLAPTETATLAPTPGVGSTIIGEDGVTLVYVPEGEFLMGTKDTDTLSYNDNDEKPQHPVTLDAFWIDQNEVTNKQYAACVSAKQCKSLPHTNSYTHPDYYNNSEFDYYPVIYVSWNDAKTYCEWAGRRLPTEAEWEKAARGTDARIYPWGDDMPNKNLLNYNLTVGDTTKIGTYPSGKSFYGAYDMAGNVWEWVNDWYDKTYYRSSPPLNPLGPDSGDGRVLRGGSWNYDASKVRSADRNWKSPTDPYNDIGFRCARDTFP